MKYKKLYAYKLVYSYNKIWIKYLESEEQCMKHQQ